VGTRDGGGTVVDEQAVLRLARRRRLGRRLGLALVPVGVVAWFVVSMWDDGAPDALGLLLLLALGAAAAVGWWRLERSAGQSVAELYRQRGAAGVAGAFTDEELDDARAELALRTCSPPPPGGRARVEGLVDRWARDARAGLLVAPAFVALALAFGVAGRDHGVPVLVPAMWALLAVFHLVQSLRRRRATRRWTAAHGAAARVAGRP